MPAAIIRTRRRALGLTQAALAAAVGVSVRSVQEWEAGRTRPQNSHLIRLSRALDVPLECLA